MDPAGRQLWLYDHPEFAGGVYDNINDFLSKSTSDDTPSGVCAAVSHTVLRAAVQRLQQIDTPTFLTSTNAISMVQVYLDGMSKTKDREAAIRTGVIEDAGLHLVDEYYDVALTNDTLPAMLSNITAQRGYYVISMTLPEDAHMVVAINSPAGYYFFDANKGMYLSANAADFARGNSAYLLDRYSPIDDISIYKCKSSAMLGT
jgi:hypothetical protein